MLHADFINTRVELFPTGEIFSKHHKNRASYSKTDRPFIGYRKEDNSVLIEPQHRSYLKATGSIYFILTEEPDGLMVKTGIRLPIYVLMPVFIALVFIPVILIEYLLKSKDFKNTLRIAPFIVILFPFITFLIEWLNARFSLYKHVLKRFV